MKSFELSKCLLLKTIFKFYIAKKLIENLGFAGAHSL